jgi:hypothetical protein
MVLLSWLSTVLVILVFVVLAFALIRISGLLRAIGGTPTSFLAKLRFGLRAIDAETAHLKPQVTRLNDSLGQVAEGLGAVDRHLADTLEAARRQEG